MADQETWAKRVAEWKASGLSSPAFCEGKDFTPGGLRHMAHRLGVGRRSRPRRLRIAKVVRGEPARPAEPFPAPGSAVIVELGAARVVVRPGVDRATLAAVLEALTATARASSDPARGAFRGASGVRFRGRATRPRARWMPATQRLCSAWTQAWSPASHLRARSTSRSATQRPAVGRD